MCPVDSKGGISIMTALISLSTTPQAQRPLLSILDGVHQGVALSLDQPVYVLGAGLHCDLVLSDPGIADEHLHLRMTERELAIEARGGDVRVVRGGQSINVPTGSGHRARLPVDIHIGAARLQIEQVGPATGTTNAPRRDDSRWLWMVALVALLLGGSAFALQSAPERSQPALAVASRVATTASQPVLTLKEARTWLEAQLRSDGFPAITLETAGDQLLAKGVFDRPLKSRWADLQQRFDQRFGGQVILRSSVTQRADIAAPRVRFQAVWFGTDPYVISDSGKRLYPGAALPDDWVLERIDPDAVVLSRGDERFSLTL